MEDDRFYEIRGNYLILPYAQVKNINLEYFRYDTEPPGETDVREAVAEAPSR